MKYILLFLFIVSLPSLSFANKFEDKMSKKEKKTYNQYVLRGELEGNMVFTIRNIKEKKGLVTFFDEFEDRLGVKEKGVEFNIKYSDKGHKNDWERWGNPGHAQRFQIMEPLKKVAKKNQTKWYRVEYFLDGTYFSKKHNLSIFDFKPIKGKSEVGVGPTFNYTDNRFSWTFNSEKFYTDDNEVGGQNYYNTFSLDLNQSEIPLKGKWVNLIINAKWADDGFLHLWIDGKLVSSYYGQTLAGADKIRIKFGPYRNYMDDATSENIDIPDLKVKYANIGKSNKCNDLWSGCDELTDQLSNNSQAHFAHAIIICETAPNKDTKCRNSGWPQEIIPF